MATAVAQQTNQQRITGSNGIASVLDDAWSFALYSGLSMGTSSKEAALFRGNGLQAGLQGQYFMGPIGLGINAGFLHAPLNNASIQQFMLDRKFPQGSTFSSSPAQNAFLLAGPSFRVGERVQIIAGIKGGLFINQSGNLDVGQQGAIRPLYRVDAGNKTLFPGFNGSLSFAYPLGHGSAIQLNADFLRSSSAVLVFDPQQGVDIATEQKRKMEVITTGISFVKTFGAQRDVHSALYTGNGQSSGKRIKDAGSGQPTGMRQKKPVRNTDPDADDDGISIILPESMRKPVAIKTKATGAEPVRIAPETCGPVTTKITQPDGHVEEHTFACPEDAANFMSRVVSDMPQRISTNFTVPKNRTAANNSTVYNNGVQPIGSNRIISGKVIRNIAQNAAGVVTNAQAGSGASSAAYAATGRNTTPPPTINGVQVKLYAREPGSGMASGKRSREAGSGLPTGKRQYLPVYADGYTQEDVCNPCLAVVKNPIYEEKGKSGQNPMFESRKAGGGIDNDCDGKAEGLKVELTDLLTGVVIATTTTNACGEYWFANVPQGDYAILLRASFVGRKGYHYYMAKSDMSVAGEVLAPNETWQHLVQQQRTGSGKASMQDIHFVVADNDGDGLVDFTQGYGTFADGSSRQLTTTAARGTGAGKASMSDLHFAIPASSAKADKVYISDLHISKKAGADRFTVTAGFTNGSRQDISELTDILERNGVMQISLQTADTDGDGAADLIWSPRSNICVNASSANVNKNVISATVFTNSTVQKNYLPIYTADTDGDGIQEIVIGNELASLGGALPGGAVISAALRPGNPIGGLNIKGGKNPGGFIESRQTNDLGEFEFTGLSAGDYTFTIETNYVLNDRVEILWNDLEDDSLLQRKKITQLQASQNSQSLRTNNANINTPSTKAQDHNSTRSNKTASIAVPNTGGGNYTVAKRQLTEMMAIVLDAESKLKAENVVSVATVGACKSAVADLQIAISEVQQTLAKEDVANIASMQSLLQIKLLATTAALQNAGGDYAAISNVLKTKHETAKNAIVNVR